jgi:hypothetical protein
MILRQCQRQNFTPIQNQRQNYNFIYSKFHVYRQPTGIKKKGSGLNGITRIQLHLILPRIKFRVVTFVANCLNCCNFGGSASYLYITILPYILVNISKIMIRL